VANETFLDASGATKYRKSTGAGSAGDPAVAHNIIDSGTVTATQSGTWTVQPGNTANTTAWLVTGTGGTFPVTGTITANIGTIAGLATETTVQSSLDRLGEIEVHLSNLVTTEDTPHLNNDFGIMALAVRRDSLTATAADGDYISLSTDSAGRLYVTSTITGTVAATQSGTWTVTGAGGTFPVTDSGGSLTIDAPVGTPAFVRLSDGAAAITTLPVSLTSTTITGTVAATQSGTWNVTVNTALPTGSNTIGNIGTIATSITPGTAAANLGKAEDAVHATGDTGVAVWSVRRDTAASGAGTDGDYASLNTDSTGHVWTRVGVALPAGTNNIGDVDVLSISAGSNVIGDVGLSGRTSGGLTLHRRLSTGTDSTNVKNAAGQLFWAFVTNTNASARYIKFYNSASAPTLGSGTPVLSFLIPPGSSGLQITAEQGLAFSTGIGYTLSTGVADTDVATVAANEIVVNLGYR
jgi:hypothetical protein